EPGEQAAAHRRARAREAGDERERLRGAHPERLLPAHLARDAPVGVALLVPRGAAAEQLRSVQEEAVQRQEDRSALGRGEDRAQLGHTLEETQDNRLEVRDHLRRALGPDWNQASARNASPTRKAAIPCFT